MIMESNIIPEVIPIWLTGFDDVMPNKYPYYPLVGKVRYLIDAVKQAIAYQTYKHKLFGTWV